jgi:hypothetical protein
LGNAHSAAAVTPTRLDRAGRGRGGIIIASLHGTRAMSAIERSLPCCVDPLLYSSRSHF